MGRTGYVELGSRSFSSGAQADPWLFDLVPLSVGGKPTRIIALGIDCDYQLDAPATTATARLQAQLVNLLVLRAGVRQSNREIFRLGAGSRLKDFFRFKNGRAEHNDPASIASASNAARRQSICIYSRRDFRHFRRPKDFDIPAYALREGGSLTLTWGVATDVTSDAAVDSFTAVPWVRYEVEESEDLELTTPWRVGFVETSDNSVTLPRDPMAFLAVMNGDRDHSDQTTTHLDGYINQGQFRRLAEVWNMEQAVAIGTAADTSDQGAITIQAPEFLPLLYPTEGSKVADLPSGLPPLQITRTSTDTQRYVYLTMEEITPSMRENAAAAHGISNPTFVKKFVDHNKANVRLKDARAAKFMAYLPEKIARG